MFWKVVKLAGATTATSVTFLVPVVATILGIAVLDESLQWYEPVGALIVFVGVGLAGRSRPKPTPPPAATPPGAPSVDVA
jgi:drug/metabolite transporter (DMT)-like permease